MPLLQSIYNKSPILLQHLMATVSGYRKNRNRYGRTYKEHRIWLRQFDTLGIEEKRNHQLTQLRQFLQYAVETSEFYREHFSGININHIKSFSDLRDLPFLEKEALRANLHRVVTVPQKGSLEAHTGGTTGKPLIVRNTPDDVMKRMAMLDHFKSRVGFEHRKMRRASFMGKPIAPQDTKSTVFWRYNHACKQMLYSSFHLTEANLPKYVEHLNRFKPHAIDGFFSSMLDIANYMERHGIRPTYRPVAIFPTSETVTDEGREVLERVFGAKVYNQYASSEGAPFITECAAGTLHIEHSTGVFEQLESENHEIVVTSFTTHGTPLIRYKIGDLIELGQPLTCSCGIQSASAKRIEGRRDDYLLRTDGGRINSGIAANLFKNLPNSVIKSQIIQTEIAAIRILLEIDQDRHREAHDDLLRREFYQVFSSDTHLTIEHVDEIPREASGKHRLVNNMLLKSEH